MQDKACCTMYPNPLLSSWLDVLRKPVLCSVRSTAFKGEFLRTFKGYLSLVSERRAFLRVPSSHLRDKTGAGRFSARIPYSSQSFFPIPFHLPFYRCRQQGLCGRKVSQGQTAGRDLKAFFSAVAVMEEHLMPYRN